ncbi:MAG: antibiotic biosynthesis monooxygenase, partial [Bradyrhizobium sp.]
EDFQAWRGLVGQYFAAPPEVEHTQTVLTTD